MPTRVPIAVYLFVIAMPIYGRAFNRCGDLFTRIQVIYQGHPNRDEAGEAPNFWELVRPYNLKTSVSDGGAYYSKSMGIENLVEIRKTSNGSVVHRFQLREGYAVRSISSDGQFAVLTNFGNETRNGVTILKVIHIPSDKEILQLSKPPKNIFGLRYGFLSKNQLYVQTVDAFLIYELFPKQANLKSQTEAWDTEFDEARLLPIPNSPFAFQQKTWQLPEIVRVSSLETTNQPKINIDRLTDTPTLTADEYNSLVRAAQERGNHLGMSLERMQSLISAFAQALYDDVYVSKSGKLAVISGHQGMGDGQGGGNYETFFIILDLHSRRVVNTLYVPLRNANRVALSPNERFLAWAGPEGLQVFDMQNNTLQPSYSYLSRDMLGAYIYHLEWSDNHTVITSDNFGRIVKWNLPL